jgi:hypothetical protein
MKLSFGNMIFENIFNICKQPRDIEDVHEVNLIETLVQNNFLSSLFSDPLEAYLAHFNNFDEDSVIGSINYLLEFAPLLDTDKWRTRFEEFPPCGTIPIPLSVQTLNLELKLLPSKLKYAFLGQVKTF